MAAKDGDFSLILKLLGGIIIGALLGLYIGENAEGSLKHVMDVVVSLRHIFGQIIFFLVPLVIVGFITPAIVRLGQNASKILLVAVALAYVSSLGAALFSMYTNPHRLTKPLYRAPYSEKWEEKDWGWMLEKIARRVKDTRDKDLILKNSKGQTVNRLESIFMMGTSHASNEECAVIHQAMRGLGVVQMDHQARV